MRPVPNDGFLQVDLVGIEPKLPNLARKIGYEKKGPLFQVNFI